MSLEIVDGGILATVQDGGRPGWGHLGVPPSGACDPWSLAVANLLVGNEPGAAGLELTLGGMALRNDRSTLVGLAGAELGARVAGGRALAVGRSHRLATGETIVVPGAADPGAGARSYLAVPGGIDVPAVLGSRSTLLGAGFGGYEGRALQAGDVLAAGAGDGRDERPELAWPADSTGRTGGDAPGPAVVRVLAGPRPGAEALVAGGDWTIAAGSDRVGLRLAGQTLPDGIGGEVVSHGVTWGAIQVPADGGPIVLLADHQTTGGYPVIAVAIRADRPILGQLRAGATVRFEIVDERTARAALAEGDERLQRAAAALRDEARWGSLSGSSGDWR